MARSVIFPLLIFIFIVKRSMQCPKECACLDRNVVSCSKDVTGLPQGIPTSTRTLQIFGQAGKTKIKTLDSLTFNGLVNLTVLEIENSGIERIELDAFKSNSALKKIALSNNNINHIAPAAFHNTASLMFLDLSDNLISKVPPGMLVLKKLNILSLKNNKITSFSSGVFQYLDSVTLVDLSGNPIGYFPSDLLKGLQLLRILRLNNCGIRKISEELLSNVDQITTLELNDNHITDLHSSLFKNAKNLKEIFMDNNAINNIQARTLSGLSLNLLSLKHNKIVKLDIRAFEQFTVRLFFLDDNYIQFISPAMFRHMGSILTRLSLAGNPLEKVSQDMFFGLQTITILDLSRTNISEFTSAVIGDLNLQFLNISNNHLTQLDNETLHIFTQIKVVDLSDNPWQCNCNLKPLFRWLQTQGYSQKCDRKIVKRNSVPNKNDISTMNCLTCDYPDVYANKLVTSLSTKNLEKCVYSAELKSKKGLSLDIKVILICLAVIVTVVIVSIVVLLVKIKRQRYSLDKSVITQSQDNTAYSPSKEVAEDDEDGYPKLSSLSSIEDLAGSSHYGRVYGNSFTTPVNVPSYLKVSPKGQYITPTVAPMQQLSRLESTL